MKQETMTSTNMPNSSFDTVCVVGLGYIGLPTAAFIASKGINVIGVDVNEDHVNKINMGEAPFYEPDFEATLTGVVARGDLTASTKVPEADAYIIAVPTPFGENHELDPSYIKAAAESVAAKLTGGEIIVLESTSPPGTTEKLANFMIASRPDLTLEDGRPNSIYFAHCPERVLPGRIMVEMATNDRIIGGLTGPGTSLAYKLYSTFCTGKILTTDSVTAEMSKLTENSFRDVNIAFANELSIICKELGIDVWELIRLANHHPRVNILEPGPGVGGHCIAVDPWFIISSAPENARILRTSRQVNDYKPKFVFDEIRSKTSENSIDEIVVLGLTFKANIDDTRNSPAIEILKLMVENLDGVNIKVVDPYVKNLPSDLQAYNRIEFTREIEIASAQLVVVLVDHQEFQKIPLEALEGKIIIDTRGIRRFLN